MKLKECPFCGNTKVRIVCYSQRICDATEHYSIRCPIEEGGCGVETAWYSNRETAEHMWNRRIKDDFTFREVEPERNNSSHFYHCSNCHRILVTSCYDYCPHCGCKINWRDALYV